SSSEVSHWMLLCGFGWLPELPGSVGFPLSPELPLPSLFPCPCTGRPNPAMMAQVARTTSRYLRNMTDLRWDAVSCLMLVVKSWRLNQVNTRQPERNRCTTRQSILRHGGGMTHFQVPFLRALVFGLLLSPLTGQWISYPTAGVPRTPDGKPDLTAACPRTSDGKPDLSGLWVMQPNRDATPNFPG